MSSNAVTTWTPTHGKLLLAVALSAKEIGQRLQQAREMRGLTQVDLAHELYVSPSTIARWEAGKLPPIRELIRVAEHLGIDAASLVESPISEDPRTAEIRQMKVELADVKASNARMEEMLRRLLDGQDPPSAESAP